MEEMPVQRLIWRSVTLLFVLAIDYSPVFRRRAAQTVYSVVPTQWLSWASMLFVSGWRLLHLLLLLIVLVSSFFEATHYVFSPVMALMAAESVVFMVVTWKKIKNGPDLGGGM